MESVPQVNGSALKGSLVIPLYNEDCAEPSLASSGPLASRMLSSNASAVNKHLLVCDQKTAPVMGNQRVYSSGGAAAATMTGLCLEKKTQRFC